MLVEYLLGDVEFREINGQGVTLKAFAQLLDLGINGNDWDRRRASDRERGDDLAQPPSFQTLDKHRNVLGLRCMVQLGLDIGL